MTEDNGFYLLMLDKREATDVAVQQCYSQLCSKLGYYNTLQVAIDGKTGPLIEAAMSAAPDPSIPSDREPFFIFRGMYMKAFEDGIIMVKLIRDIAAVLNLKLDEFDAKLKEFASKPHCNLRTVYWYIDKNFISKKPPTHQVSFAVDNLLFGCWSCNSSNVIGMHLVALSCMMDVKQFHIFLPGDLAKQPIVTNPPFKGFLEKKSIALTLTFKDVKVTRPVGSGIGAGVAKTVDKTPAKGPKTDVAPKDGKNTAAAAKEDKKTSAAASKAEKKKAATVTPKDGKQKTPAATPKDDKKKITTAAPKADKKKK